MIPDDITSIIQEIDRELKEENTPPQGRPIAAIIKFGQRFGIPMLFSKPIFDVNTELQESWKYGEQITTWYEEVYGDQIKVDPSANARVVVHANGDLWELRLPIIFGSCVIFVDRNLTIEETGKGRVMTESGVWVV